METPLKVVRLKYRNTQLKTAEALGIDQGHYSRIERGEVQPSPELARRIATLFGDSISPMEILDPKHYMPKPVRSTRTLQAASA